MSFQQRYIDLYITKGSGTYAINNVSTNADTVKLSGYRVSTKIGQAGGASLGTADVTIYGLSLDLMNQLSTLGQTVHINQFVNNLLTITAGEDPDVLSTVFQGTIYAAWADFQAMPEVSFHISANVVAFDEAAAAQPTSFPGEIDVATALSTLCSQLSPALTLENNGVSVKLSTPYYGGSVIDQISAIIEHSHISAIYENGVLAIWPANSQRNYAPVEISPQTGMVGYPAYTANGIALTTLYNPSIKFGAAIAVTSSLTGATGTWTIFDLNYDLDSMVPHGKWFISLQASRPLAEGSTTLPVAP